jgi:hypothetical protein
MTHLHRAFCAALLSAISLAPPNHAASASPEAEWVAFRIRTILTSAGVRTAASDATVRGPAGTDLALELRQGPFELSARLRTDLVASDRVRIAARLTARRTVGTSERGLPFYEEDVLRESVEVAADGSESMALLPFGPSPDGDELAVEVVPELVDVPAGSSGAPEIRIHDPGPGGWIRIEASRVPHAFDVEASIVNGAAVATGRGRLSLEEPGTIDLPGASLHLTVDRVLRGCPREHVAVSFDLDRVSPDGARAPVARQGSGIADAGEPFEYSLAGGGVLRLRVTPVTSRSRAP